MSPQLHVAEPPAPYLARPALVIDCSVLAGLVFREHWYDVAQDHLQGRAIHAPHLLMYEITNVALKILTKLALNTVAENEFTVGNS